MRRDGEFLRWGFLFTIVSGRSFGVISPVLQTSTARSIRVSSSRTVAGPPVADEQVVRGGEMTFTLFDTLVELREEVVAQQRDGIRCARAPAEREA